MLRVLLIVQKLLQENKHSSKRDIYYMHPSVFLDQSVLDRAINDICVLMQWSHHLNVVDLLHFMAFLYFSFCLALVIWWILEMLLLLHIHLNRKLTVFQFDVLILISFSFLLVSAENGFKL